VGVAKRFKAKMNVEASGTATPYKANYLTGSGDWLEHYHPDSFLSLS
jgi:hypothetical protein